MKSKWIDLFMKFAEEAAKLSSCSRLQVGAVIVKNNRVISIGYNGTPSGWDNCCEVALLETPNKPLLDDRGVPVLKTKEEVIHAEANAIIKLARDGESGMGSTLFITHAPCIQCAKLIYGAGIEKVYYKSMYRDNNGIEFLFDCDVEVEQYGKG